MPRDDASMNVAPVPDSAKWEEEALNNLLANILADMDLAVLVASSLGKTTIRDKLNEAIRVLKPAAT